MLLSPFHEPQKTWPKDRRAEDMNQLHHRFSCEQIPFPENQEEKSKYLCQESMYLRTEEIERNTKCGTVSVPS